MNDSSFNVAIRFVLSSYTAYDQIGDELDTRYILYSSYRVRLPISVQAKIDDAIQYLVEEGYLTEKYELTVKGYKAL